MTIYSYSRVSTFYNCPAQFKFRYIDRTPSPAPEGIELFLGSRFHETMEYLYGELPKRVPTVNELMDYFKKHWETHWKEALLKQKERNFAQTLRVVQDSKTVEDYFQKGQLFVENYYHQYQPFDQDKTEGIETKVAFNLDDRGQYKMQGYIDRLGRDDEGVLWIHDYKTSSRKLSAEDVKNEDQLALYQIGLQQDTQFGPQEKIKLIWHFVAFEKDQVVSERNPKEINWLKQKYISKIQTIEKTKEFQTRTGPLCQWCEFLSLCADGKAWMEKRGKKMEAPGLSPKPDGNDFEVKVPEETASKTLENVLPPSGPKGLLASVRKGKKNSTFKISSGQLGLFNEAGNEA